LEHGVLDLYLMALPHLAGSGIRYAGLVFPYRRPRELGDREFLTAVTPPKESAVRISPAAIAQEMYGKA